MLFVHQLGRQSEFDAGYVREFRRRCQGLTLVATIFMEESMVASRGKVGPPAGAAIGEIIPLSTSCRSRCALQVGRTLAERVWLIV